MTSSTDRSDAVGLALRVLLAAVAVLWLVEIVDARILDDALERQGIQPRTVGGLDGILWAPFLHDDIGHLLANTVPLIVLGGLVLLRGVPRWTRITAIVVILGGTGTWLFARSGNHIGASSVVFGYLGALVGAAFFERSIRAILIGLAAGLLYGGLVWGILPTGGGVSWEGHLFGLGGGAAAAWLLSPRRPDPA